MDTNKNTRFISANNIAELRKNNSSNDTTSKEPVDNRTLYERLQEQRAKKEEAIAEANKLGNRIHRIDEDESEYLIELLENEKKRKLQIEKQDSDEVAKFKKQVASTSKQEVVNIDMKFKESQKFIITKDKSKKDNKLNAMSKLIKTKGTTETKQTKNEGKDKDKDKDIKDNEKETTEKQEKSGTFLLSLDYGSDSE